MKINQICFFFFLVVCSGASANPIKFGLDSGHAFPLLYQFENQNITFPTGGLIYEVSAAIGDELREDYTINSVPGVRINQELLDGSIDLNCHTNTRWNPNYTKLFDWSKILYTDATVLVGKKEISFERLEHVVNAKIGTVISYNYDALEESFKKKVLQRVDSPSMIANINKIIENRVDYVVMSEAEFIYHKSTFPQLQRSKFTLDKMNVHCALSKRSSISLKKLNEIIDRLKKKQAFQNIYKRYLNPKTNLNPILYGLNDTNSPPFLIYDTTKDNPTILGGVFFDIGLEIGKKLKRPVKFLLTPRKRLDSGLAEGRIEIVCYNAEPWAGEYAQEYLWSIPIFKHSNYVVSNSKFKGNAELKSIKDLKGKTIGTTLGFVYPNLMPYFEDGSVIREDVLSGSANVSKLNAARIPLIILNNLEYNYYKKTNPDLQRAPFDIDPMLVKCAVSKKADLKIEDINAAIIELKKTGRLQKIFSR